MAPKPRVNFCEWLGSQIFAVLSIALALGVSASMAIAIYFYYTATTITADSGVLKQIWWNLTCLKLCDHEEGVAPAVVISFAIAPYMCIAAGWKGYHALQFAVYCAPAVICACLALLVRSARVITAEAALAALTPLLIILVMRV